MTREETLAIADRLEQAANAIRYREEKGGWPIRNPVALADALESDAVTLGFSCVDGPLGACPRCGEDHPAWPCET